MSKLTVQAVTGDEVAAFADDLARLRIEVFREFPYLYDGEFDYERDYIRTYVDSPRAVVVVASTAAGEVVGVSTGLPLADEDDAFKRPFVDHGYDVSKVFYFGESVLRKPYRGQGVGVKFFHEREAHAQRLGGFDITAFCAVDRPTDHSMRPADYVPLDRFWTNRGYTKHPELRASFSWLEIGRTKETVNTLTFWLNAWRRADA